MNYKVKKGDFIGTENYLKPEMKLKNMQKTVIGVVRYMKK